MAERFSKTWKRCLDDCFCIWNLNLGPAEYLANILNRLHLDIKFTFNTSQINISFLDVLVIISNGKLTTFISTKPTDILCVLSCHPRHVKIGVPNTLATRLKTIVSDDNVLKLHYKELKQHLRMQGYSDKIIDYGIAITDSKSRENLLTHSNGISTSLETLPVVTTHIQNGLNLCNLINNTIDSLKSDKKLKSLVPTIILINSKRQAPNSMHIITRTRLIDKGKPVRIRGTVNCFLTF